MTNHSIRIHPRQAIAADSRPMADPVIGHRVELQLLTTLKCNLKCSYCSLGVGEVLGSQTEVGIHIDELAAFADPTCRARRSTSPSTAVSPR
jgi:uncharacterized protein